MKNLVCCLVISAFLLACTKEVKSPIEGAWQMVYGQWQTVPAVFPTQVNGGQIKMFSKEHFTFVGQFKLDTMAQNNFGSGTYKFQGNQVEEKVVYSSDPGSISQTFRLLIEFRNDTLIQKWPADENWSLPEKFNVEKYIRLN